MNLRNTLDRANRKARTVYRQVVGSVKAKLRNTLTKLNRKADPIKPPLFNPDDVRIAATIIGSIMALTGFIVTALALRFNAPTWHAAEAVLTSLVGYIVVYTASRSMD